MIGNKKQRNYDETLVDKVNQNYKSDQDSLRKIHETLNKDIQPLVETRKYLTSPRNNPKDDALRELLLEVHKDAKLAEFVKNRTYFMWLYNPDTNNETGWYLDWAYNNGKVQWVYQQPVWGMGRGGSSIFFESYQDRFYANGKELLDIFPKLTVEKLEQGIETAIMKDKELKTKK